jgi:aminocarboxymuconate-semialdehyde decarboxylase
MPIDAHAHYVPRQLLSAVAAQGADIGVRLVQGSGAGAGAIAFEYGFSTRPLFPKLVEPAKARRDSLDRQGLDRQIVATWPDMYGYGLEPGKCIAWHRLLNSTFAEWANDNAERFSWMASVPLTGGDAAAEEIARAVADGAVAAMLPANVEGVNIGELPLDAFWSAAERLAIPVVLHPVSTVVSPRAARFGLNPIVQYTFDTTLGAGSLFFSGVLDRFPGLTLILSHGGGAFPYLAGRFDLIASRMDLRAQGATSVQAPSFYMRAMAYDTAVYHPKTLRFLADMVGLEQIVIGTDEAFPAADVDPLSSLVAAGFSDAERRLIADENPRRLFPRLR